MEKGSSSSSSPTCGGLGAIDSLNGLKFGKKIYFEDVGGSGLLLPPKSSPSAKRGRTGVVHGGGGQPPRCQVEGCEVDLSGAKAYYSRHKVCGMHSKSPKVIVAGLEQRFCQQCSRSAFLSLLQSRFHQLPEFDQVKRSCRRRLAGHNERRRKPQLGSSFSSRYGNFCTSMLDNHSKSGSFLMNLSTAYPSLNGRDSWLNNPTTEQALGVGGGSFQWQSSTSQNNPLSEFLQVPASHHDLSISGVSSEECISGGSDSAGALSLLSNQPWNSRIHSSGHWLNDFLGSTVAPPSAAHPEPDAPPQFTCPPWSSCFKVSHEPNTIQKMVPELGLGQPPHNVSNGNYNLAQPRDGEFSESVHHTHWSL